jgi:hypothetical protein|tara:strand:- start:374 stop:916 length:543 start_codon:yes stop_codon:yes gene_type:complete
MAWEIWVDDGGRNTYRSYANMGFFCNTADVCFGPVFYVDSCFDKGQFYEMWGKAGFTDPRKRDSNFESHAYRILTLMGYDDNVTATLKVLNRGKVLYEETRKECYDNLSFTPFQESLEAESEEDFDMICALMEGCENDMKHLLLTDPDENATFQESQYKSEKLGHDFDIRVEMNWEVLDD